MTLLSNPPGATAYLDNKEVGRTPCSVNFDFYGKREFRLVKEGYETKTVILPVRAPWYQWIGIDFVAEVLLPGKLTDHKFYEFDMQPDRIVPSQELVDRGEDLRRLAHAEGALRASDGGPFYSPPGPEGGSLTPYEGTQPPGASIYQQPLTLPPPQQAPILAPPTDPRTYVPPL